MESPKANGGLGILDPAIHAKAMCAKFLVSLASGQHSWSKMALACLELAKLRSQGDHWRGVGPFDKLLAPGWTTLSFRGLIGALLNKCKSVARTLEWGDKIRYFENALVHWSPWLSKVRVNLENPTWREVAQKLNNKGIVRLKDLWDDSSNQWLDRDEIVQCHSLSLFEDVIVNRLLQVL